MPMPDLSTLTPEQRQSFDSEWVKINSGSTIPLNLSLPSNYNVSIDDDIRRGVVAMAQSGYVPYGLNTITGVDPEDVIREAYQSGNGDIQDTNNALALLGMALTAEFNQSSANQAMQFGAEQAKLNRDWQERMSNTAYQRAMQDLKDAGLNPILAYTQGGAATTSGATASGFSSSGSSASGVSANSSLANFDFATHRDQSIEQYRMGKEITLKKMDYVDHTINNIISGLLNMGSAILRGGNTYNFNK